MICLWGQVDERVATDPEIGQVRVSCIDKWHHYLCGKRDVTVHSDH